MRFVLALCAFVVAAAMIALGIAQRTVLLPPPRAVVTSTVADGVRYVVVPGSALHAHPGQQRVHIEGDGPVFAAYGRTSDVTAWLAGERYQRIGIAEAATTASRVLATAPRPAGTTAAVTPGPAAHPDPAGSDLWIDEQRGTRSLDWTLSMPASLSLLIAADGASPAPGRVTVSWPVHATTPYATPLIIGGGLLAVVGLLLYIWALVHLKRKRGPRRRPPAAPRTGPVARQRQPTAERSRAMVSRVLATGGVTAAGALLLAGCSVSSATPAPAATGAPIAAAMAQPDVVTAVQAQRIVRDAAAVARKADRLGRASLLTPRFTGAALVLRKAAYAIRKHDRRLALPQAMPTASASIKLVLPERTSVWPRTLFAVLTDTATTTAPPLAMTLVQQSPRENYRVQYLTSLVTDLPTLPSAVAGAQRVSPDTTLLSEAPAALAADYGLLLRHPKAKPAARFATKDDPLMATVGAVAKKRIIKNLGATARIRFTDRASDPSRVVAFATADGGAIASVGLTERWTVKPVKKGVTVKPSGATKALSGVRSTGKGVVSSYGYQLLFSVPPAGSKAQVTLLGYAQGLISAKEL